MLKVYKGQENTIYATFRESMIDICDWIYLEFRNDASPEDIFYTILKDNLTQSSRVDKFILKELTGLTGATGPDLENAEIVLPKDGYYYYSAYELDKDAIFDEESPAIIKLIEKGRCFVVGSSNLVSTTPPDLSVYE